MQLDVNFRLQIYTTEKNQTEAELDCRREPNRHLVIFDEEWKINAVESTLMLCTGYHLKDYWIDGTRQNILTDWKFTDGRNIPMAQTTFWHMDNPDSPNKNKSCLRLKYRGTVDRYRLDDRKCDVLNPYICEY
ncbi:uncharacterized protein LOC128547947 [Mercenaria mercenaria]|uniref:uncharacterized protein LOC128547947 n=1 Tax=Mercenaria mercenaria TaxID=6596 RepID=UPI00234E7544|nr:uncharacterized protein LOC128547947 [Mercenaria mercenaria]